MNFIWGEKELEPIRRFQQFCKTTLLLVLSVETPLIEKADDNICLV